MLPIEIEKTDPRVRRTRQLLVNAFDELLESKGFSNINVNDITDRAGVNRATFYAHFPDKYALLSHATGEAFRSELESRVLNACTFNMDNLRVLVVTVCEFVGHVHRHTSNEEQYQTLVEAQIREQVYGLILHWLENMDTIERCTVSRERAATAVSWSIYGLAHQWAHEKNRQPSDEFASEVLPLLASSLGLTVAVY